ncbi:MAG: hypothetical protein R3B60_00885 [Candidatus Paceibacterota bacterium]
METDQTEKKVSRSIAWEAPEYEYKKKGGDWYFSFALIIIALVVAALLFENTLLALLIIVSGLVLTVLAIRKPSIVPYAVTVRGIKVEDQLHPYSTLKSFYIDEDDPKGPHLLVLTKRHFAPIMVIPLPIDHIDEIEFLVKSNLKEEHLEESAFMRLLENFGF